LKFIPAQNKLEAVARISSLTNSGPETLGPGSKERKSVLINLAKGLKFSHLAVGSKHEIANSLATQLKINWTTDCHSIGQTITLKGLNLLLEASTNYLGINSNQISKYQDLLLSQEVELISNVVVKNTPRIMDGHDAVLQMKLAEYTKWRETEWQGFYFEFIVLPKLINALGGGPLTLGNTEFDYSLKRIWDMKTHSMIRTNGKPSNSNCPLNDAKSIEMAVGQMGFGLIVLTGLPKYDMGFTRWHKKFRSDKPGEPRKPLKKSFFPQSIDMFYIPNLDELNKAKEVGLIKIFNQGRQQSGAIRGAKYSLNIKKSLETDIHVFSKNLID
jgi:hypothetical protein